MGDLGGQVEQVVGLVPHGADDDDHVGAVPAGAGHVVGDGPDPVGVGHGAPPELLHDR